MYVYQLLYISKMKTESKYAGIGTVLIKENKWALRRPLEKVSMTTRTYNTSTTMARKRDRHIYKNTYKKNSLEYKMRTNDS